MENRINIFTVLFILISILLLAVDRPIDGSTYATTMTLIGCALPILLFNVVVADENSWTSFFVRTILTLKSGFMAMLCCLYSSYPCNAAKLTVWHAIQEGVFVAFFPFYVIDSLMISVAIFIVLAAIIFRNHMFKYWSLWK